MNLPRPARLVLGAGLRSIGYGAGWARVEAGAHYPSDVLFGAALGNFTARLLNDAFLDNPIDARIGLDLNPEEPRVWLSWSF